MYLFHLILCMLSLPNAPSPPPPPPLPHPSSYLPPHLNPLSPVGLSSFLFPDGRQTPSESDIRGYLPAPLLPPECKCWRFSIHNQDQITAHDNHFVILHVFFLLINYSLNRSMAPYCWSGHFAQRAHGWRRLRLISRLEKCFEMNVCMSLPGGCYPQ